MTEVKIKTAAEQNYDAVRALLIIMFNGWNLHEASWDADKSAYTRDEVECMVEAAGGDQNTGYMVYLFDHWGNDIQDMAAHYGVGWGADGKVRTDIPPPPETAGDCKNGFKLHWDCKKEAWLPFGS